MKQKLIVVIFFILLFIFPSLSEAYSFSSDGPYLSFEASWNSRRIQENCSQCVDAFLNPLPKVYATGDSTRLLAKLGIRAGILDAYLTVGGATLNIDEFNGYSGSLAPAFGGGLNFTMYESPAYGHFSLFINPDVLYFKTSDTLTMYYNTQAAYVTESHDITWTETTVRIGGYSRYDQFAPYGGISVSFVSGQESGDQFGSADIKERDNLGFFLGANFYLDPSARAALYGEFGGGDNNYVKVGIRTRF